MTAGAASPGGRQTSSPNPGFLQRLRESGQALSDDQRLRNCGNKFPRGDVGDADEILQITKYCERTWLCPICGYHEARDRSRELTNTLTAWTSQGGSLAWLTLTQRHTRDDELPNLLHCLWHGWDTMVRTSCWQADRKSFGVRGYVRITEVVYRPENGWNPHIHVPLLLYEGQPLDDLQDRVATRFCAGIRAAGGQASPDRQDLCPIPPGDERRIAKYCVKGTTVWRSDGSRTPFAVLADLQETGEGHDLWKEFTAAVTELKPKRYSPSKHLDTLVRTPSTPAE